MNTYLIIITTVLVATQIIRITQNAIQLHRQNEKIGQTLKWIEDNDISERDFEIQREVFYMLHEKLKKGDEVKDHAKQDGSCSIPFNADDMYELGFADKMR